ncbi:hypothetical protein [Agitococcus lubricus]|uniref:Uncharacterized protein n=1 Tax=Agitococcus lubricus TaxID=1077255 RepID=A0A2T5ITP1_9GAMM|nr:hypothetical protein [Agitococcus lubricus]PTQ87178.1 hypothetical protein C8N29_12113 [Agitococcus lubricus]
MKLKQTLITAYVGIAILFGLYGSIWGQYDYKGFFYNMGRGLIWPAIMFPSLGKVIALILILAMLVGLTLFGKRSE